MSIQVDDLLAIWRMATAFKGALAGPAGVTPSH